MKETYLIEHPILDSFGAKDERADNVYLLSKGSDSKFTVRDIGDRWLMTDWLLLDDDKGVHWYSPSSYSISKDELQTLCALASRPELMEKLK